MSFPFQNTENAKRTRTLPISIGQRVCIFKKNFPTVDDSKNSKQARRKFRKIINEHRQAKNNTSMYEFSTAFPSLNKWGIQATYALKPGVGKRFPAFPL